ncbi:MAG TPA: hypothetical protein VGM88_24200 [Kofleriaceae bacterium]
MILRAHHLDAMARAAHETFVDRLVDELGCTRMLAEAAIPRARAAGITSEAGIARYVELSAARGLDFDQRDRTWRELRFAGLDETAHVEALAR